MKISEAIDLSRGKMKRDVIELGIGSLLSAMILMTFGLDPSLSRYIIMVTFLYRCFMWTCVILNDASRTEDKGVWDGFSDTIE